MLRRRGRAGAARRPARGAAPVPDRRAGAGALRSFAAANAATLVLSAAFYAAILCNVLFLTSVWRLSVLEAGLAVTPAPLVAVIAAGLAPRIAERFGERAVVAPGALLLAAGVAWFAFETGAAPRFVAEWLPGMVLVGAGVGLAFPALGNAALAAVPDARLATACAVGATARQIGAVVGSRSSSRSSATPARSSRGVDRGWTFCAALAAGVGGVALATGRRRPVPTAIPNHA